MSFFGCTRLLFVSPHADDAEFGCGGLLAQLAHHDDVTIHVAVMTHRKDTLGETVQQTMAYQTAAMHTLGLERFTLSNAELLVRRLPGAEDAIRSELQRLKNTFKPDAVFGPHQGDRMQDHHTVACEVERIFRDTNVFEYEVVSSSVRFEPNLFVQLDNGDIDKKIRALHCHKSQSHRSYFSPQVLNAQAVVRGVGSWRFKTAEAFRVRSFFKCRTEPL